MLMTLRCCAFLVAFALPAAAENLPQGSLPPLKAPAGLASGHASALIREQPALTVPSLGDTDVERTADFIYLLRRPATPSSTTIVLMHGSGGDETSLMALAEKIAPDANLLGVRGRVKQAGINRWYRRLTPTTFDQQDITAEAKAFVASLSEVASSYGLDLNRAVFLGYSNGANMVGAISLLYPSLVHRAVLMRSMPVLEQVPESRLDADILLVSGTSDTTYRPFAPKLETLLASHGARVESLTINSGHLVGDEDAQVIGEWLSRGKDKLLANIAK